MSTSSRCGYQLQTGLTDETISDVECDRPAWEDHDRCIWHAKEDDKPRDDLEAAYDPGEENFDGAYLREAPLTGVDWFAGKSLAGADLTGADLEGSDFSGANMLFATMTGVDALGVDFEAANLEGAVFTDADIRRATLVDARLNEAVFTNVHIGPSTAFGDTTVYERESFDVEIVGGTHPLEAAAWAYRELQHIFENNGLPKAARDSYNREKDARRRLAWNRGQYREAAKWELSRLVMHYGSSPYRILGVSAIIIVVAAILYPVTGGILETQGEQAIAYTIDNPERAPGWWIVRVLGKSLYFSVVTFITLGYGDIQPLGTWARLLASIETILGSLLSALLVFVLARSVTW